MWRGLVIFVIVVLIGWCVLLMNENRKLRETVEVYEGVVDGYAKELMGCVNELGKMNKVEWR